MEIVIAGASGFIGSHVLDYFTKKGHHITMINREHMNSGNIIKVVENKDVLINLVGESIAGRWTKRKKRNIQKSRIDTSKTIVNAINASENPVKTFIQASAVGIYDTHHCHSEDSKFYGSDFLAEVVKKWEKEAMKVNQRKSRLVIIRMGIVLGRGGGFIEKMRFPLKMRIGIFPGKGNQYFSFIHIDDLVRIIEFIVLREEISGVVNVVSPDQKTFNEFIVQWHNMLKPVFIIKISDYILKLIFGMGASVFNTGQNTIPKKLQEEGFKFICPDIFTALARITVNKDKTN